MTDFQPKRTIAIGDIHGCSAALKALLDAVQPNTDDLIITLGDYVDRGPDSRGVIEQLFTLQDRSNLIPILGNHEIMMLASVDSQVEYAFWLGCGGQETLESYGGTVEDIPRDHLEFLAHCRRFHETDSHIFLHANYDFRLELEKQPEHFLFWEHVSYNPPQPHKSGKTAIVGHTPQPTGEILDLGHLICIDTYCFGGAWLTALDVQSGRLWQANQDGDLRE